MSTIWCSMEYCKHRDAEHDLCNRDKIWIEQNRKTWGDMPICTDYEEKEAETEG